MSGPTPPWLYGQVWGPPAGKYNAALSPLSQGEGRVPFGQGRKRDALLTGSENLELQRAPEPAGVVGGSWALCGERGQGYQEGAPKAAGSPGQGCPASRGAENYNMMVGAGGGAAGDRAGVMKVDKRPPGGNCGPGWAGLAAQGAREQVR